MVRFNLMKCLICLTLPLLFIVSEPSFAASKANAQSVELSKDAQELRKRLDEISAFGAAFLQEVTDPQGEIISRSQGKILLQRPGRFLMHTTVPDELALFTRDGDIYYYDASINQVSIFSLDRMADNPLMLLARSSNVDWAKYSISRDGDRFTLIPKTKQDVRSVTLSFSSRATKYNHELGGVLESLTIRMDDGNTNFYLFRGHYSKIYANDFEFVLPKDVEYDDER